MLSSHTLEISREIDITVISEFVKVEAILPEGLRAYFQYMTNPINVKMDALSRIAGSDIFGRGNGYMSIIPERRCIQPQESRSNAP